MEGKRVEGDGEEQRERGREMKERAPTFLDLEVVLQRLLKLVLSELVEGKPSKNLISPVVLLIWSLIN